MVDVRYCVYDCKKNHECECGGTTDTSDIYNGFRIFFDVIIEEAFLKDTVYCTRRSVKYNDAAISAESRTALTAYAHPLVSGETISSSSKRAVKQLL